MQSEVCWFRSYLYRGEEETGCSGLCCDLEAVFCPCLALRASISSVFREKDMETATDTKFQGGVRKTEVFIRSPPFLDVVPTAACHNQAENK